LYFTNEKQFPPAQKWTFSEAYGRSVWQKTGKFYDRGIAVEVVMNW